MTARERDDAEVRLQRMLPGTCPAWVEAADAFVLHQRAGGRSPASIRVYRSFIRNLAVAHPAGPWTVTTADLVEFLARAGWKPATRHLARTALRSFYLWAEDSGRVERSPAAKLPPVPVPAGRPKPTPETVVVGALDAADDRERLMVHLARLAGLRRGEIASLHVDSVQADHLRITGKGGKTRIVPLHPVLAEALRPAVEAARARGDGWIFPATIARGPHKPVRLAGNGRHLTPNHVGNILKTLLGDGYTAHTLRHAAASAWYGVNRDLLAVQTLLGHTSPATTQRYVALPDDALRAAVLGQSGG